MFVTLPLLAAVFFLSAFRPSSPVHCSLPLPLSGSLSPLTLSPSLTLSAAPLSWRLRLPRSDAHKGRSLSHREGLHWSLHSGAGALPASIQLLEVTESDCASLFLHTHTHAVDHFHRHATSFPMEISMKALNIPENPGSLKHSLISS